MEFKVTKHGETGKRELTFYCCKAGFTIFAKQVTE
jgi:hypothetical protein